MSTVAFSFRPGGMTTGPRSMYEWSCSAFGGMLFSYCADCVSKKKPPLLMTPAVDVHGFGPVEAWPLRLPTTLTGGSKSVSTSGAANEVVETARVKRMVKVRI